MNILREFVRYQLNENDSNNDEFIRLLNKYVQDSDTLNSAEKRSLAVYVESSKLDGQHRLERIDRSDPDYQVGDLVNFIVKSFTLLKVSEGQKAGHIAWKSSDEAITVIQSASRGMKIDYNLIKVWFDSDSEKEVLVTGNYRVMEKLMITEPGTAPQYDYKVPMYVLKEVS